MNNTNEAPTEPTTKTKRLGYHEVCDNLAGVSNIDYVDQHRNGTPEELAQDITIILVAEIFAKEPLDVAKQIFKRWDLAKRALKFNRPVQVQEDLAA